MPRRYEGPARRSMCQRPDCFIVRLGSPGGGVDLLSSVLRELRLDSATYRSLSLRAPWRLRFDGGLRGVHIVVRGSCLLALDGMPRRALGAGDLVVLPQADSHILSSPDGTQAPMVSSLALARRTPGTQLYGRRRWRGDPDRLRRLLLRRAGPPGRRRPAGLHRRARAGRAGCELARRPGRRARRRSRGRRRRQRDRHGPHLRRPGHPRPAPPPRDRGRAGLAARAAGPGRLPGARRAARGPQRALDRRVPSPGGRAVPSGVRRPDSPAPSAGRRWTTSCRPGCARR